MLAGPLPEQLDLRKLAVQSGEIQGNLAVSHYAPPPQREKGIMVEDTAQLVQELKNRGLV